MREPNPYAPPRVDERSSPRALELVGGLVRLAVVAFVLLVWGSLALNFCAVFIFRRAFGSGGFAAMGTAETLSFYLLRWSFPALVTAYLAGVAWLGLAWKARPPRRNTKPASRIGPGAVVVWSLVPIVGLGVPVHRVGPSAPCPTLSNRF